MELEAHCFGSLAVFAPGAGIIDMCVAITGLYVPVYLNSGPLRSQPVSH